MACTISSACGVRGESRRLARCITPRIRLLPATGTAVTRRNPWAEYCARSDDVGCASTASVTIRCSRIACSARRASPNGKRDIWRRKASVVPAYSRRMRTRSSDCKRWRATASTPVAFCVSARATRTTSSASRVLQARPRPATARTRDLGSRPLKTHAAPIGGSLWPERGSPALGSLWTVAFTVGGAATSPTSIFPCCMETIPCDMPG